MKKKIIDERQERDMLLVEHYGFWFAFYSLLAIILIQSIIGKSLDYFIYEWGIFMILTLFVIIGFAKKGIWRPTAKPSQKEYISTAAIMFIVAIGLLLCIQWVRKVSLTMELFILDVGIALLVAFFVYIISYILGSKIKKMDE